MSVLVVVLARELNLFYTELGTEPNLETLTLFVRPPTAVSVGGQRPYKKG